MNRHMSRALGPVALATLMAIPFAANSESNVQTGAGPLTANAKVDFQITIPKVLFLQVGSGTAFANNPSVALIDFTVATGSVGNGTPVAASLGSGDLGNGTVTAKVFGNGNGNVSLVATNGGALSNGAGGTIDWSQITTNVANLSTATALTAPTLANTTSNTVTLTPTLGIVNQDAKWTYSYANNTAVPGGTYGGINTNNGRVTYTATLP